MLETPSGPTRKVVVVVALAAQLAAIGPEARTAVSVGQQPTAGAHPSTLEEARVAFTTARSPWQYRPVFGATFDSTELDDQKAFLSEMVSRGIFHAVVGAEYLLGDDEEYLTSEHFARLEQLLRHARAIGLHVTLFDEYGYPSGSAAGKVAEHGDCRGWKMTEVVPGVYTEERGTLAPGLTTAYEYPDLLNPECMQFLLDITHRRYESELGEFFPSGGGDTIVGMYTDEPGLYPNPAGLVPVAGTTVWTGDFEQWFRKQNGYGIRPRLEAVFRQDGRDTVKVRLDYWRSVVERLDDSYYGEIERWADQAGVTYFGHLFDDDSPAEQQRRAGDYLRWLKAMHAPGIDVVLREDEHPWHMRQPASAASEAGRAWAYVEGHNTIGAGGRPQDLKTMVDASLARGNTMYWLDYCCERSNTAGNYLQPRWQPWADRLPAWSAYFGRISQLVSGGVPGAGVAVLNPWSSVLGNYPMGIDSFGGESGAVADSVREVSVPLDEAQVQWHYMTEGFLGSAVRGESIAGGRGESYRALVLPHADIVPVSVARAVREFWRAGGTVIAYRAVPDEAAEGPSFTPEVREISAEVFGVHGGASPARVVESTSPGGGHAWFVPEGRADAIRGLLARTAPPPAYPLAADRPHLLAHTSVFPDGRAHLLVNPPDPAFDERPPWEFPWLLFFPGTVRTGGAASVAEWSFEGTGLPELWDTETGEVRPAPVYRVEGGRTIVPVNLPPGGSVVVALRPGDPESRPHVTRSDIPIASVTAQGDEIVVEAEATEPGRYRVEGSYSGREFSTEVVVDDMPQAVDLDSGWRLCVGPSAVEANRSYDAQSEECQRRGTGSWTEPDPETGAAPLLNRREGTYSRTVGAVTSAPDLSWVLDLGDVGETARVTVNGRQLGDRNWAPYIWDLTDVLGGRAALQVLVQATEHPSQDAGILGPARLIPIRHVKVTVPVPPRRASR